MVIYTLGISSFFHDSAACLLANGELVAAAQEERFSRKKHDESFPEAAIRYVLSEAGIGIEDVSEVVFYEKPFLKFERLLETYHAFAPSGLGSFLRAMPLWLNEKLFIRRQIREKLGEMGPFRAPVRFVPHHLSHAASAFYPSPFSDAAILTMDGVGEWATSAIYHGCGTVIRQLAEQRFPHSLGLFYSACTYYLGFRVNSGEYKLMGLAPYGDPDAPETQALKSRLLEHVIDIQPDGAIHLHMEYFRFATGLRMTHDTRWEKLLGVKRRLPEAALDPVHCNLALSIQQITELAALRMAAQAKALTGAANLVMAGGVALNCVVNAHIQRSGLFDRVWVQPASGDAGGALGAALAAWYAHPERTREVYSGFDGMKGSLLGPAFSGRETEVQLERLGAVWEKMNHEPELMLRTAHALAAGKVVGWFQGRMEYGPRALGSRSILADARNADMQRIINLKIKLREGFRPFAPAVLEEDAAEWFDLTEPSPYMLFTAPVKHSLRLTPMYEKPGVEKLIHPRSALPAVTHVDYSARVQTVAREPRTRFRSLLESFKALTGTGVLINTSFNVRGEPMVCTPTDAWLGFMRTDMDILVIGDYWLEKSDQPAGITLPEGNWQPD